MESCIEQDLRIDRIRVKPRDPLTPKEKKQITRTARSIRDDGLLHPITVRTHPEEPGSYELVTGYKRLQAYVRLELPEIRCKVYSHLSEKRAEMIRLAENFLRSHADPNTRYEAVSSWVKLYLEEHPETVKRGAPGGLKSGKRRRQEAMERSGDRADAREEAPRRHAEPMEGPAWEPRDPCDGSELAPPTIEMSAEVGAAEDEDDTLNTQLGDAMQKSPSTVKQVKRIALFRERIPEDIRNTLFPPGSKSKDHADLVRKYGGPLIDLDGLRKVAQLVESGLTLAQAIEEMDIRRAEAAGDGDARPIDTGCLPDEDWLQKHVGKLLDRLNDYGRGALEQDALLWRRLRPPTDEFRRRSERHREVAMSTYPDNPFLGSVNAFLGVKHPKDWTWCGACGGSGEDADGSCGCCQGVGYLVQLLDPEH